MEEGEMSDGANSSASSRSQHLKPASGGVSQPEPEAKKNKDRSRSFSSSRSRSSSSRSSHSRHRHSASRSRSRSRSHRHRSHRHRKHGRKHSKSRSQSGGRHRGGHRHRRYRDSRSRSRSGGRSYRRDDHRGSSRRSTSRSPLSGRRRHVGDRDHPIESKCLGVFGLSLYTTERDLTDLFTRYGPVDKVQMVYDYHTGKSRGFAFVYMKHREDAVEAKESLPGMELDGHKIRVDYSITQRAHTPTPGQYLGRTGGGGFTSRRLPYASKRTGHRSMSRSRSGSYSPRRY